MGRRTRGCCAGIERGRGRDLAFPEFELEYKFEQNLIPNLSTLIFSCLVTLKLQEQSKQLEDLISAIKTIKGVKEIVNYVIVKE